MWAGGCVTAPATWASPPGRRRRSVHRSAKTAPRRRFGAFVYTVAPREDRSSDRGDAGVYTDWLEWPLGSVSGHSCTLLRRESRYEYATRAASGGTSASATMACRRLLAGPSRLVGKTGSERVAPLPGRHLRRGVNPHEPPKGLLLSTVPKTSGAESFEVGGTWETWPTITLVAEARSAVSVGDGSSSVAAEGTFAAGDVVVIDMEWQAVTANGADATARVSLESDFFALVPGENALIFSGCSFHSVSWVERWA